jgi:hypothetical protein
MNGLYAVKPWYARRLGRFVDLAVTSLPADTARPAHTALRLPTFTAPDTAASVLSR